MRCRRLYKKASITPRISTTAMTGPTIAPTGVLEELVDPTGVFDELADTIEIVLAVELTPGVVEILSSEEPSSTLYL